MKFLLCIAAVAAASNSLRETDLTSAQNLVTAQQQSQMSLINRMTHDSFSDKLVNDFVAGVGAQINHTIMVVEDAMSPYTTSAISDAVGNFLLLPYVQTTTTGASLFLTMTEGHRTNHTAVSELASSYNRLADFSSRTHVPVAQLQQLSSQLLSRH